MPPRKDDDRRASKGTGRLFAAVNSFAATIDGVPTVVQPGDLIREGHPLLRGRSALVEAFDPVVRFERKARGKG